MMNIFRVGDESTLDYLRNTLPSGELFDYKLEEDVHIRIDLCNITYSDRRRWTHTVHYVFNYREDKVILAMEYKYIGD